MPGRIFPPRAMIAGARTACESSLIWAVLLLPGPCLAMDGAGLWEQVTQRSPWVFLGDSNTYAGRYVAEIDARLHLGLGDKAPRVLNLGMSSETASGMSEPDHPFKRPCVHQRLDKLLRMVRPQVVFVCYGMNDGIYHPDDEEIFAAYRRGMLRLSQAVHRSGAMLVCLTPPPFEPEPVAAKGKLGPSPAGRYAYFAPVGSYDLVLERQSRWCLENEMRAELVIDIHTMLHRLRIERQQQDPGFSFSGDGVHFGVAAHHAIATEVLRALGAPRRIVESEISEEQMKAHDAVMRMLRDAYLTATGKNRPGLPAGLPVWLAEQRAARMIKP